MNADAFRQLYHYHFTENRKLWDGYITALSQEQYTQPTGYSVGSVRDQAVHLMAVEDTWFCGLRGVELPDWPNPADFEERAVLRARWDAVEQMVQAYLDALQDALLFTKPFPEGEDENLIVWQVLLHVVNHATDHRAQMLRALHDLGVKTGPQDFVFYLYDHTPVK